MRGTVAKRLRRFATERKMSYRFVKRTWNQVTQGERRLFSMTHPLYDKGA